MGKRQERVVWGIQDGAERDHAGNEPCCVPWLYGPTGSDDCRQERSQVGGLGGSERGAETLVWVVGDGKGGEMGVWKQGGC